MSVPIIPRKFRERYNKIVPDKKQFYNCLATPLPQTIRINTLKIALNKAKKLFADKYQLTQLPFCDFGFKVNTKIALGKTQEHQSGYYYVQEAASMIPPLLMELKPDISILDMCAAPGSKTTEIAQITNNKANIVANEKIDWRIDVLKQNLKRCGATNCKITSHDATKFPLKNKFDRILLDAPCSSEGNIRKDWKTLSGWSKDLINNLASLQKKLITRAIQLLKPSGILIYSTCTFAPEENEEVLDYALKKFKNIKLESINLNGWKTSSGLTEWNNKRFNPDIKNAIRIWPHQNDSGGFFIAKIRKL